MQANTVLAATPRFSGPATVAQRLATASNDTAKDHFVERDGEVFAGTHLILDFWGAKHLANQQHLETALRAAVDAAGATLLHIHLHKFTPQGGVSGVAVLAESHISVHTWPERDFAAFDIFMCGDAEPEKAAAVLQRFFHPCRIETGEYRRGKIETVRR